VRTYSLIWKNRLYRPL